MEILPNVTVHEQRLAAAGGHPEGNFVQVALREWLHLVARVQLLVRAMDGDVERRQQRGLVLEITVQIHLGEHQSEVLEIKRVERLAEKIALPCDVFPVGDDVVVVIAELFV